MHNILLVTEGFPFEECERGFLETEFNKLQQNFSVCVLANNTTGKIRHSFPAQIPVYRYDLGKVDMFQLPLQLRYAEVRREIASCWNVLSVIKSAKRIARILAYSQRADRIYQQMHEILQKRNIDAIYTYWCTQTTVAAVRLKKKYPYLKVITRFHGFDLYKERMPDNCQPLRPFIAQNADLLVFACQKGKKYFQRHWPGEWEQRSIVSYLGTKPMKKISRQDKNKLVVVSCSNLIPLKRVDLIIEALALLPDEMAVEWHHLGDGPERCKLEKIAKEKLETKNHFAWKFWGAVPHDQIEQIYLEIRPDLFITASTTEGLPVSIQEALAMGITAIGTNVGGVSELIHNGKNGYLLPCDLSAYQLCEQVLRFAKLPQKDKLAFSNEAFIIWKEKFYAEQTASTFVERLERTLKSV